MGIVARDHALPADGTRLELAAKLQCQVIAAIAPDGCGRAWDCPVLAEMAAPPRAGVVFKLNDARVDRLVSSNASRCSIAEGRWTGDPLGAPPNRSYFV
jgi:hypothetical protein